MTEREWREASDMRQATVSVAAVLILAASLRFAGIAPAAPQYVQPGEAEMVGRAVAMMRDGTLNPGSFETPSLYVYVQLATAVTRFIAGATVGEFRSLDEMSPAALYTWSRSVTAVIGTATPLLVYLAGLRWGTRSALLGAALLAVVPLHVRESQVALTGVPLTFFVVLAFLLALRTHESPRLGSAAAAGGAAGLATATSYAGALALLLPLMAIWMTPSIRPSRLVAALVSCAAAGAVFILAAPYTILDMPAFLNGYARAMAGDGGPAGASVGAYLVHLRANLHWPAFLLALGGTLLAIARAVRGPGRVRWALAVAFPVVYLAAISRATGLSDRLLLPLLPFVCILAATAVVSGVSLLRRFAIPRALRTALIVALTVATLLPALIASINLTRGSGPSRTGFAHQ